MKHNIDFIPHHLNVTNLFGIFSYSIPLNGDITILHGPNGYGKTTILRLISAALFGFDESILSSVSFETLTVQFKNGYSLILSQENVPPEEDATQLQLAGLSLPIEWRARRHASSRQNKRAKVIYQLKHPDGTKKDVAPPWRSASQRLLQEIDRCVPHPLHLVSGSRSWIDQQTGQHFTLNDVVQMYPEVRELLSAVGESDSSDEGSSTAGAEILSQIPGYFIQTSRLVVSRPPAAYYHSSNNYEEDDAPPPPQSQPELRVTEFAADIARRIRTELGKYAKNSQALDSTFPERLIKFIVAGQPGMLTEQQILAKLGELEEKRSQLTSIGFLDKDSGLSPPSVDEVASVRAALHIYVDDVQKKMSVFDDLAARVILFSDIINNRFRHKRLSITRHKGFEFSVDSSKLPLSVENLSSGEQHELIVLYELLFLAPKGALILIDEPEISLHVAWQLRFVDDLESILKMTNGRAIIATHSPSIINGKWDITVELKGALQE